METRATSVCFHSFFEFSQTFYNSIDTQRTYFLFLLENTEKQLLHFGYKFSLLGPSLRQQLVLVLCFYGVVKTRILTNQCAYFLRTVFKHILCYHAMLVYWLQPRTREAETLKQKRTTHLHYTNTFLFNLVKAVAHEFFDDLSFCLSFYLQADFLTKMEISTTGGRPCQDLDFPLEQLAFPNSIPNLRCMAKR